MNKKLMALILSGVMLFQSVGFTQAADFSDGTVVESSSMYDNEKENLPEIFSDNEQESRFSDDQTKNESSIEKMPSVSAITNFSNNEESIENKEIDEVPMAVAKEESEISGKCGDNVYWRFRERTLSISGNGDMYDYPSDYDIPWKEFNGSIEKVVVKSAVTSIGAYAFRECINLTSVNISDSVTSIGAYAFRECRSLTDVVIPDNVTDIGQDAFEGCGNLKNVTLSKNITTINGFTFFACDNLSSIIIPDNVTLIGESAFEGCTNLQRVIMSNSVTIIGNCAFYGCSNLMKITIPNGVIKINYGMLKNCKNLRSVAIPRSVKTVEYDALWGCENLTDVYFAGNEKEWKKLNVSIGSQKEVKIHYNSVLPSDDEIFKLTSYSSFVVGEPQLTGIQIAYTASTPGNVSNEVKQIKWSSSDPSIAEVNTKSASYTDDSEKNNTHGTINLLTYDAGEITITGTAADGRIAEIQINIEPKVQINKSNLNISEETSVEVFSVKLQKANKKYLETFMNNLRFESTGSSVSITKKSYEISEDGKTAKYILVCNPIGKGETNVVTCITAGGQKITMKIGIYEPTVVSDYDYSAQLDKWLRDEGTANSMDYLATNENFVNSMMVAKYDSSFLGEFIENSSSLIYGGFEGWRDYWQDSTKTEQAREILVALLNSYRNQVADLSMLETADKFANIYISTLKNGNWAYATIYGLNNSEIKELSKLCTTENLTEYFLNGKYGSITKYLQEAGGYSENSKIIKCIKKFSNSSEYAKALEESYKQMGMAIKVVSLTESTINRYHNLTALFKADERYCEMLAYLKKSCSYGPIKQAASDLYDIIKGDCVKQLEYLSKNIVDELETKAVEKILDAATDNVSLVSITYKAYKYSRDIANIVFNTNDAQKQKDNMRCAAYIGAYLSRWMQYNKSMYAKSSGEDKKQYAKETVFAYYMLLKTRIAGEKSGRKYMDAIRFKSGSRQYKVSLQITSTLESMEALLKQKNVLGNKYASSTVSCPVDVDVCDSSGKTILTVYDGKESMGNVNGIYYNVYYHELDQDYVKIINFPENSGYTLRCKANDIGKVDYIVSTISGNGTSVRKETNEIPIQKGNRIEITNISQDQPTCKLIDNNGAVKQEYVAQPENNKDIPVTDLKADSEVLNIQVGKKVLANVKIMPENATIKTVLWSSSDESVARVNSDGVIEGVSAGNAVIKVVSATNDKVYTELKVTVSASGNVPITPAPKPSTPSLNKITITNSAITVKWDKASNITGYQVYRKINSGKWKSVKITTGTAYKDTNVKAGYKYSYTVKAYKTTNGKKVYSTYDKKGLSGKLNTNISLSVKNKTVTVSWKKTTGASGYYVYRSSSKTGKFSKIKTTKTLKYTDSKVKEGNTYYYKVVPFRKINNKNVSGGSSSIKNVTLAKGQTTNGSSYKFIEGVNKIIPQLEEKELNGTNCYEKSFELEEYEHISFQYIKENDGQGHFSIVCQPDITQQGNYIVLGWNEGEAKPRVSVFYVKESGYKVMGYLSYESQGNKHTVEFNSTPEADKYTLKQLNTMGNETFHEVVQMLDSCMKQNMNMSIIDLGFENY